jgi:hypothetical protein
MHSLRNLGAALLVCACSSHESGGNDFDCPRSVDWSGVLTGGYEQIVVEACINTICSSGKVNVMNGDCVMLPHDDVKRIVRRACAYADANDRIRVSVDLDLTASDIPLSDGDQGRITISTPDGIELFKQTRALRFTDKGSPKQNNVCASTEVRFGETAVLGDGGVDK